MYRVFIILFIVLMTGCSANYHLKRSQRQYEKAIKKGYTPKADTFYINDTVYLPKIKLDTFFSIKEVWDTITIKRDRVITKLILKNDSIFIETECKSDTIVRSVPVAVLEKIYIEQSPLDWTFKKIGIETRLERGFFWLIVVITVLLIVIFQIYRR